MGLWYLAGPFFNKPQKEAAEKVRDLVRAAGHKYYAPVEHMFQEGIHDKSKAAAVFKSNIDNLAYASVVLCHVDWLLPDGQVCGVHEVHNTGMNGLFNGRMKSPPLNLPDSGTIWEMGFAFAQKQFYAQKLQEGRTLRIYAYTLLEAGKMNLMLARSCDGYLQGWKALQELIQSGEPKVWETQFQGEEV